MAPAPPLRCPECGRAFSWAGTNPHFNRAKHIRGEHGYAFNGSDDSDPFIRKHHAFFQREFDELRRRQRESRGGERSSVNNAKDTRTKEQKLEAMANQSASPHEAEIARRKLSLLRRQGGTTRETDHPIFKRRSPKPHVYTASRGDALGCDTCARSKDNPHANHIKQVS